MLMNKFGIELRKIGDPKAFYRDVNAVLKSKSIPSGDVTMDVQKLAIGHSLQKMFQGSHFSICTLDSCCKICGIVIQKERYDVYSALHCVNWNEMLPDFRQTIIAMIMDDFYIVFGEEESSDELSTINC